LAQGKIGCGVKAICNESLHTKLTVLPSVIGSRAGCFCFAMGLFGTLQKRAQPMRSKEKGGQSAAFFKFISLLFQTTDTLRRD